MPRESAVGRVQDVYATSYRRLVGQLTGVTGDPVEAEDAVMEAFARAINARRSFLAADDPEAWLRTVAVDVTRTRWRRDRFFRDASARLTSAAAYDDLPDDRLALLAALRRLPAAQREAIALHHLADLPVREVQMILPTDFHREIAERVEQPGFDVVVARAGRARRRRRTTIAAGLATVVVVGGLGFALGGPTARTTDRAPRPPTTPWDGTSEVDPRLPGDVRAVLDDDRLQLWSIAGGADGAQAALWRGCDYDPCRFAVVTRDGDDVHGEALGASFPTMTAVPDGWLVEDARGISRLSPSGDRSEIFDTGPGAGDGDGDVMAGDTAVPTSDGWRLLRGDTLIPMPSPSPGSEVIGGYVTPEGRLVVVSSGAGRTEHATLGPDGLWSTSQDFGAALDDPAATRTPVVAGNGDHVAVVVLGDDPDGSIPVLGVEVSHDAGRTWVTTVDLDTEGGDRVRNMSSLAVGSDGTTYLTTESHHLVRIDDEGFATPIQLSALDTGVFASGDRVCLVTERGRHDALLCSPDGIIEWSDQPLPGLA